MHTFYDVVFTAETLRNLRIQKRDKTERPKRFRYEHVGNFAELAEVILEIFRGDVFGAPAHENLAGSLPSMTVLSERLLTLNDTQKIAHVASSPLNWESWRRTNDRRSCAAGRERASGNRKTRT